MSSQKLEEHWQSVSQTVCNFVKTCLTIDPAERQTVTELLKHEWLTSETPYFVAGMTGQSTNLLLTIQKGFNVRKTCKWFFFLNVDLCICSNSRHVPHHSSVLCLFILTSNYELTVKTNQPDPSPSSYSPQSRTQYDGRTQDVYGDIRE